MGAVSIEAPAFFSNVINGASFPKYLVLAAAPNLFMSYEKRMP